MLTVIKMILGAILMLVGVGLQARSKGNDPYDFAYGAEAVIAGMIIIAAV